MTMPNTLTRYNPEIRFRRFPDMIEQLFRESLAVPPKYDTWFDARRVTNLLETESAFIVQLMVPGIDPEKVVIQVVGQALTVKGTCFVPTYENATYLWHGLFGEEFSEVFTLPMEVYGEKVEASYLHGILTITLPKTELAKPKTVKITNIV